MVEQLLLKVNEVADALSLGKSKAYELVASGEIPSIRIGRAVRVRPEDVRQWLAAHVNQVRPERF